jgi:hypothetical protein
LTILLDAPDARRLSKYLARQLLDQPPAKLDELIGSKAPFICPGWSAPKSHCSQITFPARASRPAARRREAAAANIVAAKSRFVAPVDRGLLTLGARLNARVNLSEPLRDASSLHS